MPYSELCLATWGDKNMLTFQVKQREIEGIEFWTAMVVWGHNIIEHANFMSREFALTWAKRKANEYTL